MNRRDEILHHMGIQQWQLRDRPAREPREEESEAARVEQQVENMSAVITPVETAVDAPAPPEWLVDVPPPECEYPPDTIPEPPLEGDESQGAQVAGLDWDGLAAAVAGCQLCPELVANRTQTVFGVGNREAEWLVIGEAPGAEEDRQGEPFVGKAGQLLNQMLLAAGLRREQVYIANTLKCRPPNNRDPHPEETVACRGYLERQIALIQPKIILVVGRIAAQSLLATDIPIGKLRGRLHHHEASGTPLVVTYHPAYLLRSPAEKRKAWDDLQMAMRVVRGELP